MTSRVNFKLDFNGKMYRFTSALDGDELYRAVRSQVDWIVLKDNVELYWNDGNELICLESVEDLRVAIDFARATRENPAKTPCVLLSVNESSGAALNFDFPKPAEDVTALKQKRINDMPKCDTYDAIRGMISMMKELREKSLQIDACEAENTTLREQYQDLASELAHTEQTLTKENEELKERIGALQADKQEQAAISTQHLQQLQRQPLHPVVQPVGAPLATLSADGRTLLFGFFNGIVDPRHPYYVFYWNDHKQRQMQQRPVEISAEAAQSAAAVMANVHVEAAQRVAEQRMKEAAAEEVAVGKEEPQQQENSEEGSEKVVGEKEVEKGSTAMEDQPGSLRATSRLNVRTDLRRVAEAMSRPDSGLEIKNNTWLNMQIPMSFLGSDLVNWLLEHVSGLHGRRDAKQYAYDMLTERLIAHVVNKVTFTENCYYVLGEACADFALSRTMHSEEIVEREASIATVDREENEKHQSAPVEDEVDDESECSEESCEEEEDAELEAFFHHTRLPSGEDIRALAVANDMKVNEVIDWFYQRNCRANREELEAREAESTEQAGTVEMPQPVSSDVHVDLEEVVCDDVVDEENIYEDQWDGCEMEEEQKDEMTAEEQICVDEWEQEMEMSLDNEKDEEKELKITAKMAPLNTVSFWETMASFSVKFDSLEEKMTKLEEKVSEVEAETDNLDSRSYMIQTRLDKVEKRVEKEELVIV